VQAHARSDQRAVRADGQDVLKSSTHDGGGGVIHEGMPATSISSPSCACTVAPARSDTWARRVSRRVDRARGRLAHRQLDPGRPPLHEVSNAKAYEML